MAPDFITYKINPEVSRPSRQPYGERVSPSSSLGDILPMSDCSDVRLTSVIDDRSTSINRIPPSISISTANERNRSQSEGAGPSSHRQKRMGIYTSKASDLGSTKTPRAINHFRGFSQGIMIPSNMIIKGLSRPATAIGFGDTGTVRTFANRPLSDVREHRRGSRAPDVIVDASNSFLYAVSQLHDCILHMVHSIKLVSKSRQNFRHQEDFSRRYANTFSNIRALNVVLHQFDILVEEDEEDAQELSKRIYTHALRCLDSFMFISLSIAENRKEIVQNTDGHIIRTFLFLQQASMIEMRNACSILGAQFKDSSSIPYGPSFNNPVTPVATNSTDCRPLAVSPPQRNGYHIPPPVTLLSNESSQSNNFPHFTPGTPHSGESFPPLPPAMSQSSILNSSFDEIDEDAHFERIYSKLRNASNNCRNSIPHITKLMREQFDLLRRDLDFEHPRIKALAGLIDKSNEVQQMTVTLNSRLSQIQLNSNFNRNQPEFWQQCMGFIKAWSELADTYFRQGTNHKLLNTHVTQLMKPLHKTVKGAGSAINLSPWNYLTSTNPTATVGSSGLLLLTSRAHLPHATLNKPPQSTLSSAGGLSFPGPINTSIPNIASALSANIYSTVTVGPQGSSGYGTPIPATPLSAALGVAIQATVPNTPRVSQSSNTLNIFERTEHSISHLNRRV